MRNPLVTLATLPLTAAVIAVLAGPAEAQCCSSNYSSYSHERYTAVYYYGYNPARYAYQTLPPQWSVGLHFTGLTSNQGVRDEGLTLGGMGGHLRFRNYYWGAELAVDVLGNDFAEGGISRVSVPIQASAMLYLIPQGRFNLYLLGGLRVVPSLVRWDLPNLTTEQTFTEFGGQLGVGAELLLSRFFSLTADARGFGTLRNNVDASGSFYTPLDQAQQQTPVPGKTAGLQLSLGASFRF